MKKMDWSEAEKKIREKSSHETNHNQRKTIPQQTHN